MALKRFDMAKNSLWYLLLGVQMVKISDGSSNLSKPPFYQFRQLGTSHRQTKFLPNDFHKLQPFSIVSANYLQQNELLTVL